MRIFLPESVRPSTPATPTTSIEMTTAPVPESSTEVPVPHVPVSDVSTPAVSMVATTSVPTAPAIVEPVVAPTAIRAAAPAVIVKRPIPWSTVALAGVTVLVLAALAVPRRSPAPGGVDSDEQSERREQAATDSASQLQPVSPARAQMAAPAGASAVASRVARDAAKKAAATNSAAKRMAVASKTSAPVAVANTADTEAAATAPAEIESAPTVAAPSAVSSAQAGPPPVTITGCLEMSVTQDEFRLTETDGADAPKSRNWRTGFLRKRSAPVALVELPDQQAVHAQVGKRVAATGLLTSHELKVNSLRVVGACN